MAIELTTTNIQGFIEQYREEDGSVVLEYKSHVPKIGEDGLMEIESKHVDSIEIFDGSERLFWDNE